MKPLPLDRLARGLAGAALVVLAVSALLPALVPTLRPPSADVLEFCRAALVAAFTPLTPVRTHLALVPIALGGLGLGLAIADRVRQQLRLRRFLAAQPSRPLEGSDPLYVAARRVHLHGRVRVLIGAAAMPAFTAGFLRPRVYFSSALLQTLDADELNAAFHHELEHVRRRDPLRLATIRFLERMLFWVPIASRLAGAATEAIELRADDIASRVGRLALASAIVKAASLAQAPTPPSLPALGRMSPARRARRLLGEPLPSPRVPAVHLAASMLLLCLVWASALFAANSHSPEGGAPCNVCVVQQIAQRFGVGG